jgi:hypothetical protein
MTESYRCYFISRDGRGRSLASITATDPMTAVKLAIQRFPLKAYRMVEVWLGSDRVFVCENPAAAAA